MLNQVRAYFNFEEVEHHQQFKIPNASVLGVMLWSTILEYIAYEMVQFCVFCMHARKSTRVVVQCGYETEEWLHLWWYQGWLRFCLVITCSKCAALCHPYLWNQEPTMLCSVFFHLTNGQCAMHQIPPVQQRPTHLCAEIFLKRRQCIIWKGPKITGLMVCRFRLHDRMLDTGTTHKQFALYPTSMCFVLCKYLGFPWQTVQIA